MAQDATDALQRLTALLASNQRSLTGEEGAELGRALADLATRMEQAVAILRQMVEFVSPQTLPQDLQLTPRELEVLSHLADGRSNAEIARRCWVSENTVKFHLKNVFRKLGVRDRGQAMMLARALHWRLSRPDHPAR